MQLRAQTAGDRLDEVLDELDQVRNEAGSPPLAAPMGQILASQALLNVLSANRYGTMVDELLRPRRRLLRPHARADRPALARAVEQYSEGRDDVHVDLDTLRMRPAAWPRARRSCCCSRCSARKPSRCCGPSASASSGDESLAASGLDQERAARIREVVRIVQETGIGEITIEENGMRVSVRRTTEQAAPRPPRRSPSTAALESGGDDAVSGDYTLLRVESPMVGTFYRSPAPGSPPFVEEGDAVAPGQTLCILEAMKLMNEVKAEAEAIVRKVHVESGDAGRVRTAPLRARADQRPPARRGLACSREFS